MTDRTKVPTEDFGFWKDEKDSAFHRGVFVGQRRSKRLTAILAAMCFVAGIFAATAMGL